MQKAAIAIGVIAILGVPALTTAAPIDRTTIVAQEGKAVPPHHRKRIFVRRTPYNTNAPSHSSEHGDVGDRGGGSSGTSGEAGGGSHDRGTGSGGGGSHDSAGGGGGGGGGGNR